MDERVKKLQERVAALEARIAEMREEALLRTRALQVVDQEGRVRAALGTGADGVVRFLQTDAEGTLRVGLAVGPAGRPALVFFGSEKEPRLEVGLSEKDEPALSLFDEREVLRLRAQVAEGRAELQACDPRGKPRATLGADDEGGFVRELTDA